MGQVHSDIQSIQLLSSFSNSVPPQRFNETGIDWKPQRNRKEGSSKTCSCRAKDQPPVSGPFIGRSSQETQVRSLQLQSQCPKHKADDTTGLIYNDKMHLLFLKIEKLVEIMIEALVTPL